MIGQFANFVRECRVKIQDARDAQRVEMLTFSYLLCEILPWP